MSDRPGEAQARDQAWTLSEETGRKYSVFADFSGSTHEQPYEPGDEDRPGFMYVVKA